MKVTKIDPARITDFKRSKKDLEAFLIFCIAVAGKTAHVIANKVHSFIGMLDGLRSSILNYYSTITQLLLVFLEHGLVKAVKLLTIEILMLL